MPATSNAEREIPACTSVNPFASTWYFGAQLKIPIRTTYTKKLATLTTHTQGFERMWRRKITRKGTAGLSAGLASCSLYTSIGGNPIDSGESDRRFMSQKAPIAHTMAGAQNAERQPKWVTR